MTKSVTLTYDYLCPFARNANEAMVPMLQTLLEITERGYGWVDVTWKVPTRGDRALAITPRLPESLELLGSTTVRTLPGALLERRAQPRTRALEGGLI